MIFLKDRNLNIAILISVFWHFFCIFLFNPALATGNIREYKTSISFLGDILENVIAGDEKPFAPRQKAPPMKTGMNGAGSGFAQANPAIKDATAVLRQAQDCSKDGERSRTIKPWSFTAVSVSMEHKLDKFEPIEAGFIHSRLQNRGLKAANRQWPLSIPPKEPEALVPAGFINTQPEKKDFFYSMDDRSSLNLSVYHKKESARVNFSDFFIRGNARDRIITYKPDLDKITVLPSDFSSDFSSSVKFRISKYGFVKYAECVVSSGFSEIDQAAIRYVREWQFVPNPEDDQEGIVRVSFK